MKWSYVNIVLLILIIAMLGWLLWKQYRLRSGAKILDNDEFASMIPKSQLVDIREASDYRRKHIMGARNLPASQFSISALSKDKPVLIYEVGKPSYAINIVPKLKKAGFNQIYLLKNGLDGWNGKVKEGA